jgi:uncharacterized protein YndB with AHSA1/START domain
MVAANAGSVHSLAAGYDAGVTHDTMPQDAPGHSHGAARWVPAPPERVYGALLRPEQLVRWLPPQGATGEIDLFEPTPGGRLRITLRFAAATGKSTRDTDVIEGRFLALVPGERVVQAFTFASDAPEFAGEMTMTWELVREGTGTRVRVRAEHVPRGIQRAEHEQGMASTLENLAAFLAS